MCHSILFSETWYRLWVNFLPDPHYFKIVSAEFKLKSVNVFLKCLRNGPWFTSIGFTGKNHFPLFVCWCYAIDLLLFNLSITKLGLLLNIPICCYCWNHDVYSLWHFQFLSWFKFSLAVTMKKNEMNKFPKLSYSLATQARKIPSFTK